MSEVYYIGKRRYSPETSTLLCSYTAGYDTASLYRTDKGAFFVVEAAPDQAVSVRVVDEADAFAFMDAHAAGIVNENYDAVFGEPEPG